MSVYIYTGVLFDLEIAKWGDGLYSPLPQQKISYSCKVTHEFTGNIKCWLLPNFVYSVLLVPKYSLIKDLLNRKINLTLLKEYRNIYTFIQLSIFLFFF